MNRILLTGIAVLGLGTAVVPADAAHKQVRRYDRPPEQAQWSGSGVRVEEVLANTPAANAGIRPGDVIVGMGGRAVNGYADVDAAVAASGGRPLTIDIVRGGARARLRAAPRLAITQGAYSSVQQRFVLGLSHTEFRLRSCAEEPDCE